jgi:hypothetical protein
MRDFDDPQERARRGQWVSHDGIIWIDDMADEFLLNAYKTCLRHDNPKVLELLTEIKKRNLEGRLK